MQTPLHKRSLKSLQAKLERALQAGAAAQIHAAATRMAHPASVQGIAGWPALSAAGAAFARLAEHHDAPAFTALDAALCVRAGVAEDEHARAAAMASDDAPDGPPSAELCARWALAGRWRDLAALIEPDGQVAEGPFGVASGDVALAVWHRARREGLPLAPLAASAEAEAEREAWNRVRSALLPLYETLHACRANLLWLSLVGQLTETREDGALATRLRRAGWRFWSVRVEAGDPNRRLIIYDLDSISDGAPEWVRARGDTTQGPIRRWWGVNAERDIATWDRGPLPLAEALLAVGSAQAALEWFERHGWAVLADMAERTWTARRGEEEVQTVTFAALIDQARNAMAAAEEARV
jgi:hypothetical protein